MAYQPLLDAINNGKLGNDSISIDIKYSIDNLSSLLVEHSQDKNKLVLKGTYLTPALFHTEVQNAFFQWEHVINKIYNGIVTLRFVEVDSEADILINFSGSKNDTILVNKKELSINTSRFWGSALNPGQYTLSYHLTVALGQFFGIESARINSPLNTKNIFENFIKVYNLKVTEDGVLLKSILSQSSDAIKDILDVYGNRDEYPIIPGCADPNASNFNPLATINDGSCLEQFYSAPRIMSPESKYLGKSYDEYIFLRPDGFNSLNPIFTFTNFTNAEGSNIIINTSDEIYYSSDFNTSMVITDKSGDSMGMLKYTALFSSGGQVNIFNRHGNPLSALSEKESFTSPEYNTKSFKASSEILYFSDSGNLHYLVWKDPRGVMNKITLNDSLPQLNANSEEVSDCAIDTFHYGNLSSWDTYNNGNNGIGFHSLFIHPELNTTSPNALYGNQVGYTQFTKTGQIGFIDQDNNNGDTSLMNQNISTANASIIDSESHANFSHRVSYQSDGGAYHGNLKTFVLPTPYGEKIISFSPFTKYLKVLTSGLEDYSANYSFLNPSNRNQDNDFFVGVENPYFKGMTYLIELFLAPNETFGSLGIYSIYNNTFNADTKLFSDAPDGQTLPTANDVAYNTFSDDMRQYLSLPVSIGNKLLQSAEFNFGNMNAKAFADANKSAPSFFGNFHLAYAVKHGFLLFKINNINARVEENVLHVFGGDLDMLDSGGFTPICMVFSPRDNFLYTILENPADPNERKIGIFQIQDGVNVQGCSASTGYELINTTSIIDNPFDGELSKITLGVDGCIYIWSVNSAQFIRITEPDLASTVLSFRSNPALTPLGAVAENLPSTFKTNLGPSLSLDFGYYALIHSNLSNSFTPAGTDLLTFNSAAYNSNLLLPSGIYNIQSRSMTHVTGVQESVIYNSTTQNSPNDVGNVNLILGAQTSSNYEGVSLIDYEGAFIGNISPAKTIDVPNSIFLIPLNTEKYRNSYMVGYTLPGNSTTGITTYENTIGYFIMEVGYTPNNVAPYVYHNAGKGLLVQNEVNSNQMLLSNKSILPGLGVCRFGNYDYDILQCTSENSNIIRFSSISLNENTSYTDLDTISIDGSGKYNFGDHIKSFNNSQEVEVHEHANAVSAVISFSSDTTLLAIATNSNSTEAKSIVSIFSYNQGNEGTTKLGTMDISNLLNAKDLTSSTTYDLIPEFKVRSLEFSPDKTKLYVLIGTDLDDMSFNENGYVGYRSKLLRIEVGVNGDGSSLGLSFGYGIVPEVKDGLFSSPFASLFTSTIDPSFADAGNIDLKKFTNMTGLTTDIEGQIYILSAFDYSYLELEQEIISVLGFVSDPDSDIYAVLAPTANVITGSCKSRNCNQSPSIIGSITDTSQNTTFVDNVLDDFFTISRQIYGCMDPDAWNYNPNVSQDNGSCVYTIGPGSPAFNRQQLRTDEDLTSCNDTLECPILIFRPGDYSFIKQLYGPDTGVPYSVGGSGSNYQNYNMGWDILLHAGDPTINGGNVDVAGGVGSSPGNLAQFGLAHPAIGGYHILEPSLNANCCECYYNYTHKSPGIYIEDGAISTSVLTNNYNPHNTLSNGQLNDTPGQVGFNPHGVGGGNLVFYPTESLYPFERDFILINHAEATIDGVLRYDNFQRNIWHSTNFDSDNDLIADSGFQQLGVETSLQSLQYLSTLDAIASYTYNGTVYYAFQGGLDFIDSAEYNPQWGNAAWIQSQYGVDQNTFLSSLTGNYAYVWNFTGGGSGNQLVPSPIFTEQGASFLPASEVNLGAHCRTCTDQAANNYEEPHPTIGCKLPVCLEDQDVCIRYGCMEGSNWYSFYNQITGQTDYVYSCNTDSFASHHDNDMCDYPEGSYCSCDSNTPDQPSSNATFNVFCNCDGDHPGEVWGVSPSSGNLQQYVTPCNCDGHHLKVKDHFYSVFRNYVENQMQAAVSSVMYLPYGGYVPYNYNDVKNVLGAGFSTGNQANPTGTDVCGYRTYYGNYTSADPAYMNLTRGCGFYVDSSTDIPRFEGGPDTLLPGFTLPDGVCDCYGSNSTDAHGPFCDCDGDLKHPNYCSCLDGVYELYYPDPDGDGLIECPATIGADAIKMCPERSEPGVNGTLTGNYFDKDNPSNIYTPTQLSEQFTPVANLTSCETCTNENDVNTNCQCFQGDYNTEMFFVYPQVMSGFGTLSPSSIGSAINQQGQPLFPELYQNVTDLQSLGYEVFVLEHHQLQQDFHMPIQDCAGNCFLIIDDDNTITEGTLSIETAYSNPYVPNIAEAENIIWKRNPLFGDYLHNSCGQCVPAAQVDDFCCADELDECHNCTTNMINGVIGSVGNADITILSPNAGTLEYIDEDGTVQKIYNICDVCDQVVPNMTVSDFPEGGFNIFYGLGSTSWTQTCRGCYSETTKLRSISANSVLYDENGVAIVGSSETFFTGFYFNNLESLQLGNNYYGARVLFCDACELNAIYEDPSILDTYPTMLLGNEYNYGQSQSECCPGYVFSECAYNGKGGCVPEGTNFGVKGCDGVCGSGLVTDECGICGGTGLNPDTGCCGDEVKGCQNDVDCYAPGTEPVVDPCGTCGGSATLSDCTGCTNSLATNYDPSAIFDDGTCNFLTLYDDVLQDVEIQPEASNGDVASFYNSGSTLLFDITPIFPVKYNMQNPSYIIEDIPSLGGNILRDNTHTTNKTQQISTGSVSAQTGGTLSVTLIKLENPLVNAEVTYRYTFEVSNYPYQPETGDVGSIIGVGSSPTVSGVNLSIYQDYIIPSNIIGEASVIPKYYFRLDAGLLGTSNPVVVFENYLDKIQFITPSIGETFEHTTANGHIVTLPTHVLCGTIKDIDAATGLPNDEVLGISGFTDEYCYNGANNVATPLANAQYNKQVAHMIYEVIPAKDPEGNYYQFDMDVLLHTAGYIPPECLFFDSSVTGLRLEMEIPKSIDPRNNRFVIYNDNNRIVKDFNDLVPINTSPSMEINKYLLNLGDLDGCYYFLPLGFTKNKDWPVTRLRIMNECNILHYLDYGASSTLTGAALINTNSRNTCEYGCFSPDSGILVTDHCYATVKKDLKDMTQLTFTVEGGSELNIDTTSVWVDIFVIDLDTGENLAEISTEDSDPTDLIQVFSIYQTTRLGIQVYNPGLLSFKYELRSEYGELIISKTYN